MEKKENAYKKRFKEKKIMTSTFNKAKTAITIAIIAVLLMSIAVPFMDLPAKAQSIIPPVIDVPSGVTPTITVDTISYMSYRPNPIGLGQSVLFNLWLEPPTTYSRYLTGLTVTLEKPDGTIDTVGPIQTYQGDSTAWFEYVVDQVGEWKLKFDFPGNYWTNGTIPPGFMQSGPQYLDSAYYKPSTTGWKTLTVQEELVPSWPESMPTDYWTRPVSPENREWVSILGDYPWIGYLADPPEGTNQHASNYKFTPYVQAPNTAHIVWKRQGALSGLMGAEYGTRLYGSGEGTYAGTPSIIFEGRCYQSVSKVSNGQSTAVWQCYDLRTGEIYWEIEPPTTTTTSIFGTTTTALAPSAITFKPSGEAVPGATSSQVGTGADLVGITGGSLYKWNPYTGALTLNVSISPLTTGTIYRDPYVLSIQTLGSGASREYRLINWTMQGSSTNIAARVMNNISYPFSSIGTADYDSMIAVTTQGITPAGAGVAMDARIIAASLTTGSVLWDVTAGVGYGIYSGSTACADHGKFVVRFNDGHWYCWDLRSGKKLWKSELSSWPWGIWGAYGVASAYGFLYYMQYDGIVAYDWDTGEVAWHYSAGDSGFETPYGTWPFFVRGIQIADGKVYVGNGEHSPTSPLPRGWKLHCINATTGVGIWNITGGGDCGGMADGYLTYDNRYDGYMYVFGKGKSAITVTASPKVSTHGTNVLVEGTVLDQSPAQPGTPCVSKDSMAGWLEYLHMQKTVPAEVTGVPVSLDTLDPNGNYVHIGDVMTDGYSGTFAFMWEPEVPGQYTVTATFKGDDSYGSSFATTHVGVTEAPAATAAPEPTQTPPDNTALLYGILIVAIAALAVGLIAIFRKR